MRLAVKFLIPLLCGAALAGCGNGTDFSPEYPVGPPSAAVNDGSSLQFYRRNAAAPLAAVTNVYAGEVVPLEVRGAGAEEKVRWTSSDTGLGAFVKPGELHLRAPGTFQIQAQAGAKEVRLSVTVGERDFVALPPASPSPSPSPSLTPTPLPTPSASPAPTPAATSTPVPSPEPTPAPSATPIPTPEPSDRFVDQVISFNAGPGGGFGSDKLPGIVLGPPKGFGLLQGSLDVLSLGAGGVIVLKSATPILDGNGADFIVFENAFYANGNPNAPFAEPGEVAVSQDGIQFFVFGCEASDSAGGYPGCAGVSPVLANAELNELDPTDPAEAGGDAFDLSELGLNWIEYIRIRDLSQIGTGANAGFDLDAVSIVHQ
ncbi:MAG TPA: hypothetical protein VJP40_00690 [bacterium]|nr:hypothetical protein [bacterium]